MGSEVEMGRRQPSSNAFLTEWAQGMAVVGIGVPPVLGIIVFLISMFAQVTTPPPAWTTSTSTLLAVWAIVSVVVLAGCAVILAFQMRGLTGNLHGTELLGFTEVSILPAVCKVRSTTFEPVGDLVVVSMDVERRRNGGWRHRAGYFSILAGPPEDDKLLELRLAHPGWTIEVVGDRLFACSPGDAAAGGGTRISNADKATFLGFVATLDG